MCAYFIRRVKYESYYGGTAASQPDDDVGRTHDACMKALPLFSEFVAPLFPLLFATQHAQKRTGSVIVIHSIADF